jgi:hypothetical protein
LAGRIARRTFTLACAISLLFLCCGTWSAAAESRATAASDDRSESPSHFLAVVLIGSAVRLEGEWDGAFGGELSVGELRGDRSSLAAWAAAIGFLAFSERDGGRASAEVAVGTRWPIGLLVGISGGPVIELAETRNPRAGGQVSLWAYAGVSPYVRFGAVEMSGVFLDVGLRIPLPAGRW